MPSLLRGTDSCSGLATLPEFLPLFSLTIQWVLRKALERCLHCQIVEIFVLPRKFRCQTHSLSLWRPVAGGFLLVFEVALGVTDAESAWCLESVKRADFEDVRRTRVSVLTLVVISQTISWVSQVRLATVARISIFIE